MPTRRSAFLPLATCLAPFLAVGQVASLSNTGTLATPQSSATFTFSLTAADTVTIKTWGFGGGVNAAGTAIPAGGVDPLVALFTGAVSSASLYVDSSGNPVADADNLVNPPWSNVGNCPSAGTVQIGANHDCGDVKMQVPLAAGTYTLLLTGADYLPAALFDHGTLAQGFVNLTPGTTFQTCDPEADACVARNGNYAVDIVSPKNALVAITKCDINEDGSTNLTDLQALLKQALGENAAANDLDANGRIDVTDMQIVIDAALKLGCEAK